MTTVEELTVVPGHEKGSVFIVLQKYASRKQERGVQERTIIAGLVYRKSMSDGGYKNSSGHFMIKIVPGPPL